MKRYLYLPLLLALAFLPGLLAAPVPAVDTWDRAAVRELYLRYHEVPAVASGWTGNHVALIPGTTTREFRDSIITRVNFFRSLAGIPSNVVLSEELSFKAQAAAFVMSRNTILTHNPPRTSLGWSLDAAIGARNSNLALIQLGHDIVGGYIYDAGEFNAKVGHRTSIFDTSVRSMGTGDVEPSRPQFPFGANALYAGRMMVAPVTRPPTREPFVAWPHAGHNLAPALMGDNEYAPFRWSFTYPNRETSALFANATVTVTKNGRPMRVTIIERRAGAFDGVHLVFSVAEADGTMVFVQDFNSARILRPADLDATFDVTISNFLGEAGAAFPNFPRLSVSYSVVIFDPKTVSPAETALTANPRTIFVRAGTPFVSPSRVTGYTLSASNLPTGVSLDPRSGAISGRLAPGSYDSLVTITNSAGSYSRRLTVVATAPTGATRLSNLSLRSNTTPDARIATAGFVIAGGKKTILARLAGPALNQFGVSGTLVAPRLILYDSNSKEIQSGQAWSASTDPAGMAQASDFVGAFPFAAGSTDSTMVFTLDPGAYTLQSIGVNGASGVGLIELYDIDQGAGSLTNLSARANVGSGSELLIVGLTVSGSQPKNYLIRATGPGLTAFGVAGALTDPVLSVIDSAGRTVASNDNWTTNAASVNTANAQVGAFGQRANSLDSALVVTLPPGGYTVQVGGANGATGVALAEVYELPAR